MESFEYDNSTEISFSAENTGLLGSLEEPLTASKGMRAKNQNIKLQFRFMIFFIPGSLRSRCYNILSYFSSSRIFPPVNSGTFLRHVSNVRQDWQYNEICF